MHKWSSLACTVSMLLLCVTGLPLIFHHEISHLTGGQAEAPAMPADAPRASLDKVLQVAGAQHPGRVVQYVSLDDEDGNIWFVTLTPTPAPTEDFRSVAPEARSPLQQSMEAALAAAPHTKLAFIAFPGTAFSSPHPNTFFLRGQEPLTSKMLNPVLVDARTSQVTAAPGLPWYLAALLVSQPLHFGDYGGMPMKVLWALLDVAPIIVLGSGLYLWVKRAQPRPVGGTAGTTADTQKSAVNGGGRR